MPVTRESRPRFDRYSELLVSSLASAALLAAAYRYLVRRHDHEVAPARPGPTSPRTLESTSASVSSADSARAATVSLASTAAPVTRAVELPAPPGSDPAAAPVSAVRNALTGRRLDSTLTSQPAVFAIVGLVVLLGTVLALSGLSRQQAVAGLTDAPSATSPAALAGLPSPTASPAPASFAASPSPTTAPSLTPTPSVAPIATIRSTPRPTPLPTPRPTPTPKPYCTVVNLVGLPTYKARSTWANAGFTGTVTFSPDIPPHYTITSQSRTVGTSIPCTSGISVQGTP
jgi:hypothetical protein